MQTSHADRDEHAHKVGVAIAEYDNRCEAGEDVDLLTFLADHMDVAIDLIWYFQEVKPVRVSQRLQGLAKSPKPCSSDSLS